MTTVCLWGSAHQGIIIDFVLDMIYSKPTFGQSLENWLSINYYPLPTSWLKSSDRARSCSTFHPTRDAIDHVQWRHAHMTVMLL